MFAQHGDSAGHWCIEIDMQIADKIVGHVLKFIPANFGGQGGRLRAALRYSPTLPMGKGTPKWQDFTGFFGLCPQNDIQGYQARGHLWTHI